jgi:hypothetical protein
VASCRAFVELHDFTDLILVQALRQFLWSFRLPGELTPSMTIYIVAVPLPHHFAESELHLKLKGISYIK